MYVIFQENCVKGITPNFEKTEENLQNSLMLVTALNPHIGYQNAAKIAQYAFKHNVTIEEAAVKLQLATSRQIREWINPKKMI